MPWLCPLSVMTPCLASRYTAPLAMVEAKAALPSTTNGRIGLRYTRIRMTSTMRPERAVVVLLYLVRLAPQRPQRAAGHQPRQDQQRGYEPAPRSHPWRWWFEPGRFLFPDCRHVPSPEVRRVHWLPQ